MKFFADLSSSQKTNLTFRMTSLPTSKRRIWLRWFWARRFSLLLLFATYSAGVVFGFVCSRYLVLKREVGIGDILNAATLIFVAIVLQNLALRQFSTIRVEKDLLISCVNEVIAYLKDRSEEHTSELQSHSDLVCRLLLEKKKK